MCHAGSVDMASMMDSLHGAFDKVQIYLNKTYGEPMKHICDARLYQNKINAYTFKQTISFDTEKIRDFNSIKMEQFNVDNILTCYLYRDTEKIAEQTANPMSEANIEAAMERLMETRDTLHDPSIRTHMLEDIVDRCVRLLG
jgi:hypothetical protein